MGAIELALDEGDATTALALAERLERATDAERPLARIDVLLLLARAAVAADRPDIACTAVEELDLLTGVVATNGARAAHARAAGLQATGDGDLDVAKRRLEDAADLYAHAPAPYERAQTRLALARVLLELGSTDSALAEVEAAHAVFLELNAPRYVAEAAELLQILTPATQGAGPLTSRELQVIALVSAGRSNREIAAQLVVSEHTVHRHVANILRKLGEPTRAAAASRATRDGLV
jgi:DNA-binding NarL/FixJ family response regulator